MSYTFEGDVDIAAQWYPFAVGRLHALKRISGLKGASQAHNPIADVEIRVRVNPDHIHIVAGGVCGFLYFARDNDGNTIFDGNGNVQVNLIQTDKNGFVRIKPHVGYKDSAGDTIGYDSNRVFWTDNKSYLVSSLRNGKPLTNGLTGYYFKKDGYFIFVKYEGYISQGNTKISFYVYNNITAAPVQTFIAQTSVYGTYHIQAKKDGSEILFHMQQFPKAPPFATDSIPDPTPLTYRWERIFRFSVAPTNNPANPFLFTEVVNKEQWRGMAFSVSTSSNCVWDSYYASWSYNTVNYQSSFNATGTVSGVHTQNVIMHCYYDNNDTYKEVVFSNGLLTAAYSEDSTLAIDNTFPNSQTYNNNSQKNTDWTFSINGTDCEYHTNVTRHHEALTEYPFYPQDGTFLTQYTELSTSNYINTANAGFYAKVNPYLKIMGLREGQFSSTNWYDFPGWGSLYVASGQAERIDHYVAPGSTEREVVDATNTITYQSQPSLPSFSSPVRILWPDFSISYPDTSRENSSLLIVDSSNYTDNLAKVVTDKFNNHLLVYDGTNNPPQIKIANSALNTVVNILPLLSGTNYRLQDFFGAI
jgi:hypothetical protein